MLFEICYDGGTKFVCADDDDTALSEFARAWSEYGDTPPTAWIIARWCMGSR
mgnify:FL=1